MILNILAQFVLLAFSYLAQNRHLSMSGELANRNLNSGRTGEKLKPPGVLLPAAA